MEEIPANGCTCHFLQSGKKCISCRKRDENRDEVKCKKCSRGLLGSDEIYRNLCTECYYENY